MIPDFPIDIRIRLAELKKNLLLPDFANSLPCWLSQFLVITLSNKKRTFYAIYEIYDIISKISFELRLPFLTERKLKFSVWLSICVSTGPFGWGPHLDHS